MYELITHLLQPVLLLCLFAAGVLVVLWRQNRERRGRLRWAIIGLLLLSGLCTQPAAYLAIGSLEWRCPPDLDRPAGTEAIVVLAGGALPPDALLPNGEMCGSTLFRCIHGARLYHRGPPCVVVVTGGPVVAPLMRDFLVEQGVAKADVLIEGGSTTTYESAVETRKLLRQRGLEKILLVSDATHLPRASLCFSAQGFDVTPSGCHYRATSYSEGFLGLVPSPGAAYDVQEAMHEWLGLGWYWLRGRI